MRPASPGSPVPAERPPLPRDLMLFLTQFSAALNKARTYPAGHPVLAAATEILLRRLFLLLGERPLLTLGVGRDRLLIEGHETDPRHAVTRELAERLHRHQVAALHIRPGIEARELGDVLRALAADSWRTGAPLGLEPLARSERWPHVGVEALPLGMLELDQGLARPGSPSQGTEFWRGLVRAAMAEVGTEELPDGATVAEAIRRRRGDAAYCRAIVEWLVRADESVVGGVEEGGGGGDSADAMEFARRRVAELLAALDPETLQQLLAAGATVEQRRELVFRGARLLPVGTVLELLRAAAVSSGHSLSATMVQILGKLASQATGSGRPVVTEADTVVRDAVRQLVATWDPELEAAQPRRQLLELLVKPGVEEDAGTAGTGPATKTAAGALRVAQLGVEVSAGGRAVAHALSALRDAGDLERLLDLAERGEAEGRSVEAVWAVLSDPGFLRARILDEAADLERLQRVLERVGEAAAVPLLDALEAAQVAARRKWVLKQLERIVPALAPTLVERLRAKPWFVVRNLLMLIGSLPEVPPGFSAAPYLSHANPRVRREAFKLLVADPATRTAAILQAARDPDPGVALLALAAAGEDCPAELPPRLLDYLRETYRDADVRVAAIRLLGRWPTPAARDWLLARVRSGRGWLPFVRRRFADQAPETLAALGVLAASYAADPDVQRVLRDARRSRDAEIRAAVSTGDGTP